MPGMHFNKMSAAQCRALGRVLSQKNAPEHVMVGIRQGHAAKGEDKDIVVINVTPKDRREWRISRGGKITRRERPRMPAKRGDCDYCGKAHYTDEHEES